MNATEHNSLQQRTEEVVAYMAMSAKRALEQANAEAFRAKQELSKYQVAKEAETRVLKARIRNLETRMQPIETEWAYHENHARSRHNASSHQR
jgi:hypothetical protein